jgi:uncharacterized membrane protein YtjA (UPF0391 family)
MRSPDKRRMPRLEGNIIMLGWALTFLIVALIAALLGFGGIAGFAVEIAKIIFFVAIILFAISANFRPHSRPHAYRSMKPARALARAKRPRSGTL